MDKVKENESRSPLKDPSALDSIDQDIMDLNILQSPQQRRRSSRKQRPDDDSNIVEDGEGNLQRAESLLSGSFQKRGGSSLRIKKELSAGATTNAVAPGDQAAHD